MQNTSKTSLLSFVRRQHFIQSYTVSPTHRGKGHRVKDEIPQQCQLLQQPGAQHISQREILLCQVLTGHKQTEALCQGDTELHPGNLGKMQVYSLEQREALMNSG